MKRVEDPKMKGRRGHFERPTFGEPAGKAWIRAHIVRNNFGDVYK